MSFRIGSPSAWRTIQAWHERQAAFRQDFENNAATIRDGLTAAATNQITGTATLISQLVQKRLKDQLANIVNKQA